MSKTLTYSFCESFVDKLSDYIEENYIKTGKDLSRLAICFGGKRPALFLKRELAQRIGTVFYPPKFFTIDEFIAYTVKKHESFKPAEDLDSCYSMYQLSRDKVPYILEGRETFAQFLPWTREIISFIDQLDLENINDKSLRNIEANARIGYPIPEDINRLLEGIVSLRGSYHEEQRENKVFSRGMQYFRAAEIIDHVSFDEFDQILFCNFFYFNRSEEKVVKSLYDRGLATFIFQGDQRKWPVLDRISKNFSFAIEEGSVPAPPTYDLKLYKGFDIHSQVAMVREIIRNTKDLNNTVIVLPNPDHIIPLLSEVAPLVKDFNVSMGYPLKRSSLYSLFDFIFKAQLSKKEDRYYARDYLKVILHPFVKNLKLKASPAATRILIHKIEEILTGKERSAFSGSLFFQLNDIEELDELYTLTAETLSRMNITVKKSELKSILKEIHEFIFTEWEKITTFKGFAACLDNLLNMLIRKSPLKNYPLNINIAIKMLDIKDEFSWAAFKNEKFSQEEIFRIFDGKVSREIVAFIGSPLKGLQMLGLFETRSLNFDNVIILDVNEGVLPKLKIYEPLIPREVMISLSLDRLELEEEIQRYQFMRLISAAKNVHLVYQESKDKEKSRFVEELIWEGQKKTKNMDVIPVAQASFQVKISSQKKEIEKTPEMIKALRNHTYSASSINTYLRDPMEFYSNYVLGLKEQDDLLDEPEARHVGTFVHELLEEAFKPYLKKRPRINNTFRNRVAKIFDRRFTDTFGKGMKADSFLLRSVLVERLNRFLDNEESSEQRQIDKILYLENKFEDTITLSMGKVKFGYIVDRVDQLKNGTIMIIDYKTGSIDQMPKAIGQIASMNLSRESIRDNIKSFQIPLYFHYLNKQFKDQSINAALYNLRTLEVHKFVDQKMSHNREEINEAFMRALDFVMCEILDPETPFVSQE